MLTWKRATPDFQYQTYNRDHTWKFDGGHEMEATAAPAYLGNPKLVDPEEAFVASLSSCHMLTFLYVASKQGFQIDTYEDEAVGLLTKNEKGAPWVSLVTLHPKIVYGGDKSPAPAEEKQLHHLAHEHCFIANSIKTEVLVHS